MVHHTEVTTERNGISTCLTCRNEAYRVNFEWYCDCEGAGESMDFETWLNFGMSKGYCSQQFCSTHDVAPMHETELAEWEEGGDPCMHVVRLGTSQDWEV